MSTKDNWDDESSDEEGDTPPAPLFKGEINPLEEYHETQFIDDNDGIPPEEDDPAGGVGEDPPEGGVGEDPPEEGGVGEDPPDDYDGGAWGDSPDDDDDDDELDNYDKKLGRYVAVR